MEFTTGYTFTPFVRYFTSERLIFAHGKKGATVFSASSERHRQSGVKEIAKVSERPMGFEPVSTRLSVARSNR